MEIDFWEGLHKLENNSFINKSQVNLFQRIIEGDDVLAKIDPYITIGLILIGTIGNMLTIFAVTNRHTKKTSFTVYLMSLAIADTLALFSTTLHKWVSIIFGKFVLDSGEAPCRLVHYFEQLTPHISSWIIVSLTVERCLCVSFPHKTSVISQPKIGYLVVAVITAAFVSLNAHLLYGNDLVQVEESKFLCAFVSANYYNFYIFYWSWINLTVYCLLPFVIIVTANSITVLQVYRSTKLAVSIGSANLFRKNRQVLCITLLVSMSFIFLGMPQPLLSALYFEVGNAGIDYDLLALKADLDYTFTNMKTLNHAVNFFLYVLSGRKFRQQLKEAFVKPSQH